MYRLAYDEALNLLKVEFHGYWDLPTFQRYEIEMRTLHMRISQTNKNYRVLVDSTDFDVQSAEVSEAFDKLNTDHLRSNAGPVAIAVGSVLNRMQARRAVVLPNVRFFETLDLARTWVLEEAEPSA